MNKTIKYFNKKYGNSKELEKECKFIKTLDIPKNKLEFYRTYLYLQNILDGLQDNELNNLFNNIEIPKPNTLKELDIYRECVDNLNGINISKTGNKVYEINASDSYDTLKLLALDGYKFKDKEIYTTSFALSPYQIAFYIGNEEFYIVRNDDNEGGNEPA